MNFDMIVIGGGHAGCEAAAASARKGAHTALVTMDLKKIGAMSCNPAIGGIGKGHLVRELDVFDGLMARAADAAAIHYRMLNRSKGAAVRGPRVQADRGLYRRAIQAAVAATPKLDLIEGSIERLLMDGGCMRGVVLQDGRRLAARSVVLASGTFLAGKLHFGLEQCVGGRVDEAAATALATQLREHGLPMGRLKTGTPPRLDGRTIDWARLDAQPSDTEQWCFSPMSEKRTAPQTACAITRTTPATHRLIRDNLDRSPLYAGHIEGQGPRYCPSIEDKVARFGDRDGHQIFLEPETLDGAVVYPNGISTSLPLDVQQAFVRTIAGLERADIVQPGYAVEYDHVDPRCLDARLALRQLPGLFCAGQINGTTGYEEAAAQGLVAGLNAAAAALDMAPILFDRSSSYIGVMVDDLTLQGITEPYRMLTARAERRLWLRSDNATTRLGDSAIASGAIGADRSAMIVDRQRQRAETRTALAARASDVDIRRMGSLDAVSSHLPTLAHLPLLEEVVDDICYAPYLRREDDERSRLASDRSISLAAIGDYRSVSGLSNEMIDRLDAARPADLAEASRIRGITPAALSVLLVASRRVA